MDVLTSYIIAITVAAKGHELSADAFKTKLNTMTDSSQLDAIKMQLYMDRRSKAIEAMTNMLKKIANTNSQIIQNLK